MSLGNVYFDKRDFHNAKKTYERYASSDGGPSSSRKTCFRLTHSKSVRR